MSPVPALRYDGPARARLTVALAHGAGAPADSPFMETVATGLGGRGLRVARFEFPYMEKRRGDGRKRAPDRESVLIGTWQAVIDRIGAAHLVIGGKSLGGRIASMVAEEAGVRGVVCLGYPFHPPGKPERLRTAHLQRLGVPTLIVQGERDPFGSRSEVPGYHLPASIALCWLGDGDHSFVPRLRSGRTEAENLAAAVAAVADFVDEL